LLRFLLNSNNVLLLSFCFCLAGGETNDKEADQFFHARDFELITKWFKIVTGFN
jgi:hypothetical protein